MRGRWDEQFTQPMREVFVTNATTWIDEALPRSERVTTDGADHVPHISVPGRYVELVRTFAQRERSGTAG
jgi:pimeloyl-ACP methyl ester carboxylesterase